MRLSVSDIGSNFEENLQKWARVLGVGTVKRKIFLKVYSNRKKSWTGEEIAAATGLSAKVVASVGRQMCVGGLFEQLDGSRVVYQKIAEVHHAKSQILRKADDKAARDSIPTKRNSGKGRSIHMTRTTNKFENVGIANTGRMSGTITGNSQRIVNNESSEAIINAFKSFRRAVTKEPTLSPGQKEDALFAASQVEEEVQKPESAWNMSKVRNGVAALKTLAGGVQTLRSLYDQVHPLLVGHFRLLS